MLFLFCVALWFLLLSLALLSFLVFFFSVLFSIGITSTGEERELVYVLLVHVRRTCVYFARVNFCRFSLPLGVRGWLRLMIVAFPGLFYFLVAFTLTGELIV